MGNQCSRSFVNLLQCQGSFSASVSQVFALQSEVIFFKSVVQQVCCGLCYVVWSIEPMAVLRNEQCHASLLDSVTSSTTKQRVQASCVDHRGAEECFCKKRLIHLADQYISTISNLGYSFDTFHNFSSNCVRQLSFVLLGCMEDPVMHVKVPILVDAHLLCFVLQMHNYWFISSDKHAFLAYSVQPNTNITYASLTAVHFKGWFQ